MEHKAHQNAQGKKERDFQKHQAQATPFAGQGGDNGESHDAQHVVNQGRAQDGIARTGGELAQFLQGFDRDADRGSGQDHADEQILKELTAIKECGRGKPHHQGEENADEGNDKGGFSSTLQAVQVGFHPGGEHQSDHAQLRHLVEEGGVGNEAKAGGAKEKTGDQGAYHLR